ncbi:FHA domain-containing protein [Streptomyces sp. NBC_00083]|uniref:FHA domain-containing protein n=1 Tax=Streptomyces sp. NBC_00083 TaxID=2975647 RepID=UPI002251CA66|nr:FHA domain-containing protein [Streptomyces sp. NBC_00083]MCX5382383.1 FHA domain-containing protein [Streptomyces sp. NBC_00083]
MPTCPNGHQSGSDDWCEICGHRMGAVPPPPPPPPAYGYPGPGDPNATAQAELCPQCRTPREAGAPFCEECRWNFLTNTATSYTPLAPQHPVPAPGPSAGPGHGPGPGAAPGPGPGLNLPPAFQQGPPPAPRDPYEYQRSRPSQVNRPAEPLAAEPPQHPGQQLPPNAFQQGPPAPPQPFGGPQGGPQQQPFGGPQGGPPPPPSFQQQGPPAPPQAQQPQGDDDWMLPPPSSAVPGSRQQPGSDRGDDWPQPTPERGADDWPRATPPAAPERGADDWPHAAQQAAPQAAPQSAPERGAERAGDDWPQAAPQGAPQGAPERGAPERAGDDWPQAVPPPAPAGWSITIGPDREYFLAMMQRSGPEASGLNLPAYSPEQQRPLSGNQITIGRRRHSTGEAPDIDLSVPPEDPGVSHQHAVLVQQPDGTWAVVDQNSTNGTTVNGASEPIQPYVPVPLQDGDRVHVGAWTTITVRRG